MARGKGKKGGQFLSRQGRTGGDGSTSVESSSRCSEDMQCPVASAVGKPTKVKGKKRTAKQCGSGDSSPDNYCDDRRRTGESSYSAEDAAAEIDTPAEKPELEAYSRGSWWDVEILRKVQNKYLVHYLTFVDQWNELLPVSHLRIRSRTSNLSDCCKIHPGIDVCVMTQHPHSEDKQPAWFDAKVIDIERKPHTPKSCKCSFRVSLYRIPDTLPHDCSQRNLLPVSLNSVDWRKLSIMREARSISFEKIIAASLPNAVSAPRIWAKDGTRWDSSFDCNGASWDRSPSFESRVAGRGIDPKKVPEKVPELKPFGTFLEEEDIIENPAAFSSDDSDGDVVVLAVVPGSYAQPVQASGSVAQPNDPGSKAQSNDPGSIAQPNDPGSKAQSNDPGSVAQPNDPGSKAQSNDPGSVAQPNDPGSKAQSNDPGSIAQPINSGSKTQLIDSGSRAQPIDLGVDDVATCEDDDIDDAAISENDDNDDAAICENDVMVYDYKCLDRYSSDDECDEMITSSGRREDDLETPNPTTSSESLEDLQEGLDEVVLSDFPPLKLAVQIPLEPISMTSDVSSPLPSVDTIPLSSFENSGGDDFAQLLEQSIAGSDTFPTVGSAGHSEDSDGDDMADYLEQSLRQVPGSSEDSDGDDMADYLEESMRKIPGPSEDSDGDGIADYFKVDTPKNHGAKRSITENHFAYHGAKRRRINTQRIGNSSPKSSFPPKPRDKGRLGPKFPFTHRPEQVYPKKTMKEQTRVYEYRETASVALACPPVKGGNNLGRSEYVGMENRADTLLDPHAPPVADILARSKHGSKTGFPTQPFLLKEKRPKKVGITSFPKSVVREITYAELFKDVEPVQCNIPSAEKGPADDSSLLPSWNPMMESPAPLQEVEDDPFAAIWEDMRSVQGSGNKGDNEMEETNVEESTTVDSKCENGLEHTVTFNQEIGEVCEVCGFVVLEIENIWARDNAKRIATVREGDNDNDEDNYGSDYGLAVWDSDDDKLEQHNSIEGGSNIELIPDLAKEMQRHQKQGFHFLWRNLAGQDSNGNPCYPQMEPGGCVLSHAPGTGKTFLVISFLQSYMKKYPDRRPIIVAPKIMLQPWEKEFRKWNVDIPVHNYNQAREQGKAIFQKHQEAGVVQYFRPKMPLDLCREAMLYEWVSKSSVLVISYQMFNKSTLQVSAEGGDAAKLRIKGILLERPSIVVFDEGHCARNSLSQVKRQLSVIRTPLRVMLSGTLFQNNFEELYTCLNLARSGFVKTFAKTAGLKFNVEQEIEPQNDERPISEWKIKAAKAADAQAKKLFIEEIGIKIDKGLLSNSSPEYAQGLERLCRLTTPFVHHYTGGVLQDLPPLRDFTIVLQPAALQEKMLKKLYERIKDKTMLEKEGLLSLVCIHPSLLSQHNVGKTFTDLVSPEEMEQAATDDPAVGVKTLFVMNLLEKLRHRQEKEKMLIFCQNLDPLALLENMLKTKFGWVREQEILYIDGKVTADERQSIIERFNDPQGRIRVLVLSTKAAGEGVTLTGASRVVFMDVLWNPAVIRQAIHRAFRLGQTKVVYVYRLVITDSFEEDKYKTMVLKDWKAQTIFEASDETNEKVKRSSSEVCGLRQHDFWEVKYQSSKDLVLNELEREDAALDQPAFKHIFRHGGLFDDKYVDDPEGKGTDATVWLHKGGIEGGITHSYNMDGEIGGDSPESYDMDGDIEGGTFSSYDTDTDDSSVGGVNDDFETLEEDVLAHTPEEKVGKD